MTRIIKKIVVPRGTVPMLSKEMQVTRACVLSELIRKKAIQYGGIITKGF